ncbi:MAG: hypothetical protein EOP11_23060 [Proteobacteria bacterium]|nr:MAG: hypothetical protein EOP11_23060 [Pseudomonadota bacterium]
MKLRNGFVVAMAFLAVACSKAPKADTPEGALHRYVTLAFEARSAGAKKDLMDLSTGEALAYLQRMDDADFKKQFLDSNLKFVSLKAKDKRVENSGDVSLVYELAYKAGQPANATVLTNKKIAYLTKEGEGWKIKATKNMKTFIERKEDLLITPETTEQNQAPAAK